MKIRVLTFLLVASVLSGCAGLGPVAMAPSGTSAPDAGVGGTGFTDVDGRDRDRDEGVGGTGFVSDVAQASGGDEGVGGTGIFGVITAFGSIVVNGVHIDYEDETPVVVDGVAGTPADFAIGQVVAVEARPMGERYQAKLVEVQHAAMGPVSDVDETARTITVLGQIIQVAETDRLPLLDEWVRVSGLRGPDEQVVATRIDPVPASRGAFVRGVALPADGEGLALGGLQFDRPLINGRTINIGDEILLRGVFRARAFEVTDFVKAPKDPFGGRMSDLLVQGFVASNASGLNYVAGHNWTLPEGLAPRFSGEGLPAALFRGRWLSDDMSISPQPRIQIPGLLRNLPWALDGESFQAGDIPDLLRGQMEARGRDPLTIDPTTLPNIEQVRALVAAKGLPTGFLNAARPLTADQLSVLMEMGGADGTANGIQRFDPERFGLFLERHEAIGELIEEGEFDSAQMPQLQAIKMRLQEAGVDPAQFIGARHELAAVVGLLRLRHAVKHEGFDPKSLPLATRARLRDLLTDRGVLPAQLPAAVRVAPAP
ncbi:MAG: DUF5666 domain-containing protein [Rhodobiaceae bacterium]|nr:hypothetical protein RHODOSMS8_02800 [Rhodobiaceae bacterium]MCR9243062.1 DUF5666 domain-containing protein [Rhodobiaceae bacterium]